MAAAFAVSFITPFITSGLFSDAGDDFLANGLREIVHRVLQPEAAKRKAETDAAGEKLEAESKAGAAKREAESKAGAAKREAESKAGAANASWRSRLRKLESSVIPGERRPVRGPALEEGLPPSAASSVMYARPRCLTREQLLADKAIIGKVEGIFEHPHRGRALGVTGCCPFEGHDFERACGTTALTIPIWYASSAS